ncbi:unnamed protein product [Allacma fusca]|uniref:Uncharacterized protein n=1 Tax=Allacma fusca TaxID=39272 RepID=A0A8J2LLW8_9HEXA|nr:unnamed protein product [Allacma fusca]
MENSESVNSALRYAASKETAWDITHTDVYMPMLSISELSASDLKLNEQWIIQRKRIIYFLTMLTIAAVFLCAVSMIYVLPQMYGDSDEDQLAPLLVKDWNLNSIQEISNSVLLEDEMSPEGSKGFPTLQFEDVDALVALSSQNNDNEAYVYCVLSAQEEYQKFRDSCNAVIFRGTDDGNLTHYIPEGFHVNDIVYVRVTSPLSEKFVQDITTTFPNIQKLTVSIDKICYGSEEKDRNNLPELNLPELETLEIVNATLCPLTSWLLNKWNLPLIETISINQADILPSVCESLRGFLQKHNETLLSVQFIDCFLGDCSVADLHHNLTIIQKNQRKVSTL